MSDQAPPASPGSDSPAPGGADSLAQLTLDLAKAMLRTGYYAPDHPEAKQSLEGLHEQFLRTVGDDPALTYMVGEKGAAENVMVQGHGDGPEPLERIMIRGMAELFAPKLLDFFHRRRLVSFTLRSTIGAEELSAFVVIMSEPPRAGRVDEERERVEKLLLERHIINVSTVFEADILGRQRHLPWRVELALSRLGRDLRMLPLFQRASPEEVQRIKIQILDDLIRPLEAPELVRDFLLNCDLLAADIAVLEDSEIEREIIAQVPTDRLEATCHSIVEEMEASEEPEPELDLRRRLVLRDILFGLVNGEAPLTSELVEACVKHGAATFEELPDSLRAQLRRRRAVDTFLVREEDYLRAMRHMPPGEKGERLAQTAEAVFSELVNRGLYDHAAGILDAVRAGSRQGEGVGIAQELVEQLRADVSDAETVERMVAALADADRTLAEGLVKLLVLAGEPAVEGLQLLYGESESLPVRAHAFDAIKGIGAPALIPFLDHLTETEDEWSAIHHILTGLAGVDDPRVAHSVHRFLEHENHHVRQAALARVVEMEGEAAGDRLVAALGDEDPAVRRTAVAHLGRLGSRHPAFTIYVTSALNPPSDAAETETSDDVLVEICRTLASVAEADPGRAAEAEELLLSGLTLSDRAKVFGRLRKAHAHFDERVRVALCKALGTVGSETSSEALGALSEGEGPVAAAARAAAEEIGAGDGG